ncbi:type IV pilus modification protein PilV [Rhodoferax mekongensis]|uniref:type IV pilus modification protein PilV n=1 Tax=Rhodoferax mekongensis TaxID=3068341 RepID=UPI0028BEBFBF|nr:type IV pilus modification protein PilV [Rhodoferax sp. TBRC 17199]MDT7515797.1 type IV pilus modification protein PilV [Rhodoferax sp. TBRC 17199]
MKKMQLGATLIEALIAVLVMSLGLLGIAGLQLNALSYQKSAWSSHRVAEITNDIAEKIRANPSSAKIGDYNYTANYATSSAATFTLNNCRTSTSFCSIGQIAADDIAMYVTKAQQLMPGGAAQLTGSVATGFTATILYFDKDFVNPTTGALQTSTTCTSTTSGIDWRNCCPAAASAPAGVRCRNYLINL